MERIKSLLVLMAILLIGIASDASEAYSARPKAVNLSDTISSGELESEYNLAISSLGGVANDMSESEKIKLSEPLCAYVNFSGFEKMPSKKSADSKGWLEFFDGAGNYFKKRVLVNAQGNSSMRWDKKNISIDICEDEWEGDATTDVTFGSWVKQDSFHLKAYYTDYFRGLAVVSYRLFDDIIADHGDMRHPWQRAGVESADEKARCHPDGFPVCVYLNGEFYGVFSWQLKKHRKNMGMTKDCAEHIHLDGTLSNNFFNGDIDWTLFEIRNPKTLYCMDGSKYDGDKPNELIDESSEFFNQDISGHILSAQVKSHVKQLASRMGELRDIRGNDEEIRRILSKYFDVQGLIDYTVFSSVVNNVDGWDKNWQWITYDGEKWYVEPYDLDMTFGNTFYGYAYTEPEFQWMWDEPNRRFSYNVGPALYINNLYADELDNRYSELRNSGVIDADAIMNKVKDWYYRVGEDNFSREYEKWSDSYCVQDMVIDDNWSLAENFTQYRSVEDWSDSVTYHKGDMCRAYYMVWVANNEVTGIHPCPHPGYRDSLERVEDWITRRIDMEDYLWNYDSSGIGNIYSNDVESLPNENVESIYNVSGQRLPGLRKGVNIVRYSSGKTEKVII